MEDKMKAFPKANVSQEGMDLLDYFAAHAMNGLISKPGVQDKVGEFAEMSYVMAQAMINERKKRQNGQD